MLINKTCFTIVSVPLVAHVFDHNMCVRGFNHLEANSSSHARYLVRYVHEFLIDPNLMSKK